MIKSLFEDSSYIVKVRGLFTPVQAAIWASDYLGKEVSSSNIIYLINYGKIANYGRNPKENLISQTELKAYYDSTYKKQNHFNHPLSFAQYKESETTKHIHRLHPYKGKFIPQLVEYFLDSHTDFIKSEIYFKPNDIILDIFCGSGTTLCVANELKMHAVGIDISLFNTMLSNAKIKKYDLKGLKNKLENLIQKLEKFISNSNILAFELELNEKLSEFNRLYFPSKEFKRKVMLGEIDEKSYGEEKNKEFLSIYNDLTKKFGIEFDIKMQSTFFEKWYMKFIRQEILFLRNEISKENQTFQEILSIILSRTARSCRATTHSDLATLKEPVLETYYCSKHGRICKPLFSILKWWKSYAKDTLERLKEFEKLRSDSFQICLNADSMNVDILSEVRKYDINFAELLKIQKISGIFSSPPYVGLIDYHEQHAYSYDILNLPRNDNFEIGKMSEGQSKAAQEKYAQSIASALSNAKKFLKENYNVFLVANDKFNLYPRIADLAGMKIVNRYDRPVLNRSEKDKSKYSETIFHLKEKIK